MLLYTSIRQAWRESRKSALASVFWALTITIAALTAVNITSERARKALDNNRSELLAADLTVSSRSPIPESLSRQALDLGLATAETVSFSSVVFAGEQPLLVNAKAVTPGYPLRGQLQVSEQAFTTGIPTDEIPASGEVWLETRVLDELNIEVNSVITMGALPFTISRILTFEPDRASGFAGLSPRVMLNLTDARAAGLLATHSRATWRLLLSGENALLKQLEQLASNNPDLNITNPQEATAQSSNAIDYTSQFLSLASLCAILLGAAGILQASRRYSRSQKKMVALLRTFGLRWSEILRHQLYRLLWLCVAASIVGALLGIGLQQLLLAQLASVLGDNLPPMGWQAVTVACLTAVLLLTALVMPALLRLRDLPAISILQRLPEHARQSEWAGYIPAVLLLVGMSVWQLQSWRLAAIVIGGVLALGLLLILGSRLLLAVLPGMLQHFSRNAPLTLAGSSLQRYQRLHGLNMAAIALALTALLLLGWLRNDLINQWQTGLQPDTPNIFMINILPDQREALSRLLTASGAEQIDFGPMAIGRLVEINDVPAADWQNSGEAPGRRDGTINLSWRNNIQAANELIAGEWFDPQSATPQISLASDWAEAVGVGIGDRLRFRVGTEAILGTVVNLRQVAWDSFRINFFIVLNPAAAKGLDHQLVGNFYLPEDSYSVLRDIGQRFPNATIYDTAALVKRLEVLFARLISALEIMFLLTLAAAAVVVVNAVQAGLQERRREVALLRCFGVERQLVLRAWWFENLTLGLLTGVLSAAVATVCTWLISSQVFAINWQWQTSLLLYGVGIGVLLLPLIAWQVGRRALNSPPILSLRSSG